MKISVQCFAKTDGPENNYALSEYQRFLTLQHNDRFKIHSLVDDPRSADLIIFIGTEYNTLLDLRRSSLWKKYPQKCFVLHNGDRPLPHLPGVYSSLEHRFSDNAWVRSGGYLRVAVNDRIQQAPSDAADLLYSFYGACGNHPVRKGLLKLSHDRGLVVDTSPSAEWQRSDTNFDIDEYASLLTRSKFVLCPRGFGASSLRLFETLKAGRVPVIISDDWVPPNGPDWNTISVRVSESQAGRIPDLLERREAEFEELSLHVANAWREWFGLEVLFHRIIEQLIEIKGMRTMNPRWRSFVSYAHYLKYYYFRYWFLYDLKINIKERMRF